ncbi:FAD/NAD(P)-binding domain-containing protein [Astrocystis sublimbata]|nr:FAD/NAD(P)-binding domain-containing protein [Astrocystis sublimbata]
MARDPGEMVKGKIKVAIVGGGITGLALAAGLVNQKYLDVHVYEGTAQYPDVKPSFFMHQNAISAMLSLGPDIHHLKKTLDMGEKGQEKVELILAQGPHAGQTLGAAVDEKPISRSVLLKGFRELIPSDRLHLGKKLRQISCQYTRGEEILTLEFEDGSSTQCDCLLGADGVHSITREYLLGYHHPAAHPKNHDGWKIISPWVLTPEGYKQIHPQWPTCASILFGPKGHVNCIPMSKNTQLNAGVASHGEALDEKKVEHLDPRVYAQEIIQMIAQGKGLSQDVLVHDHAPFYARASVAIVGDAAHTSIPFAGLGAGQAMEDAAVLCELFSRVTEPRHVGCALAAYNEVRRPRTQAIVDLARRVAHVYASAEDGLHEDLERSKKLLYVPADMLDYFDVLGQNKSALQLFYKFVDNGVPCPSRRQDDNDDDNDNNDSNDDTVYSEYSDNLDEDEKWTSL